MVRNFCYEASGFGECNLPEYARISDGFRDKRLCTNLYGDGLEFLYTYVV